MIITYIIIIIIIISAFDIFFIHLFRSLYDIHSFIRASLSPCTVINPILLTYLLYTRTRCTVANNKGFVSPNDISHNLKQLWKSWAHMGFLLPFPFVSLFPFCIFLFNAKLCIQCPRDISWYLFLNELRKDGLEISHIVSCSKSWDIR